MKLNHSPYHFLRTINLNKRLYNFLIILLTVGASMIIGLLSFGGFLALWPTISVVSLSLASLAFFLSVAYEGEIYFQNIKGALNKLFNPNYIQLELARTYLKNYFPLDQSRETWPQFFIDYEQTLYEFHAYEHLTPTPANRKKKAALDKKLHAMEYAFAEQLKPRDAKSKPLSKDMQELYNYLINYPKQDDNPSIHDKYKQEVKKRYWIFGGVQAFSVLAAAFMSLGSTYLLMEAFTTIPVLMALPVAFLPTIIIPMAIISGIAYGLLTYNTITNIISNDTFKKRYHKIRDDFKTNGLTFRNGLMLVSTVALCALAIALTLCTAGTWWTIAQSTRPVFMWMRRMPTFIMGVLTPLVTSISALAFNLENTSESLDVIEEATENKSSGFQEVWDAVKALIKRLGTQENLAQLLNPFRIFLVLTVVPLRVLFFIGHLISIGLTGDRIPGASKLACMFLALFAAGSEGLEDLHYFSSFGQNENDILFFLTALGKKMHQHNTQSLLDERLRCGEGHTHALDLPTRLLMFIMFPIYVLSALWNYAFSQFNAPEKRINLSMAFANVYDVFGLSRPEPEKKLTEYRYIQDIKNDHKNTTTSESLPHPKPKPRAVPFCPCCPPPTFFTEASTNNIDSVLKRHAATMPNVASTTDHTDESVKPTPMRRKRIRRNMTSASASMHHAPLSSGELETTTPDIALKNPRARPAMRQRFFQAPSMDMCGVCDDQALPTAAPGMTQ